MPRVATASMRRFPTRRKSKPPGRARSLVVGAFVASAYDGVDGNSTGAPDGYGSVNDKFIEASAGLSGVWRLYGDGNGTAMVDSADFLAFRLAFLTSNFIWDYNGDGLVDSVDFLQFRLRFLTSV